MGSGSRSGLAHLEAREMASIRGGDLGDGGESLARDLGTALGAICGAAWYLLTHPPEASYSYAKVGY